MTDQEFQQLQELAKKYEPTDKDRVLGLFQSDLHPVFQEAHDQGHSAATKKQEKKLTELDNVRKTLEGQVTDLTTKLDEAGRNVPQNLQEMQAKHDQAIKDLNDRNKQAMQQLEQKQQQELEQKNQLITNERMSTAKEKLVTALVSSGNVDEDYANLVLAQRPDVVERMVPNEVGQVEILQKGKTIPFTASADKSVYVLFAEELAQSVPDKFKKANVTRGSNDRSTQTGEKGGRGAKTDYDGIRESVKKKDAANGGGREERAGLGRLGGRRT